MPPNAAETGPAVRRGSEPRPASRFARPPTAPHDFGLDPSRSHRPWASAAVPPRAVARSPAARRWCRRTGRAAGRAALRSRDCTRVAPDPRPRPRSSPRSRAPRRAPRSGSVPISPITASSACRRAPGGAVAMATGPSAVSMATPRPLLQRAPTGARLLKRPESPPDWPSWPVVLALLRKRAWPAPPGTASARALLPRAGSAPLSAHGPAPSPPHAQALPARPGPAAGRLPLSRSGPAAPRLPSRGRSCRHGGCR